jgi:hypothetical protein
MILPRLVVFGKVELPRNFAWLASEAKSKAEGGTGVTVGR